MVERDCRPYGPVAVPLILSGQIIARFHQAWQQAAVRVPNRELGRRLMTLVAKRTAFAVLFRHF